MSLSLGLRRATFSVVIVVKSMYPAQIFVSISQDNFVMPRARLNIHQLHIVLIVFVFVLENVVHIELDSEFFGILG